MPTRKPSTPAGSAFTGPCVIVPSTRLKGLRWLQYASVLAAALGAGVAVSATWLAWRERFHAPVTGMVGRALAAMYDASGGGPVAYRACESWAGHGAQLAFAASITFLLCAGARALHARWFRWLGWLFATLLLGLAIAGFLAGAAAGFVGAFERGRRHPELPGYRFSDKPPGPDPSVTKTETEWIIAVGGTTLVLGSLGALFGSAVVGGFWLIAVGGGATRWIRAKRAPRPASFTAGSGG